MAGSHVSAIILVIFTVLSIATVTSGQSANTTAANGTTAAMTSAQPESNGATEAVTTPGIEPTAAQMSEGSGTTTAPASTKGIEATPTQMPPGDGTTLSDPVTPSTATAIATAPSVSERSDHESPVSTKSIDENRVPTTEPMGTSRSKAPSPTAPPSSDAIRIISGAVVIIVVIVLAIAVCLCCVAKCRKHKGPPPSDGNFKPPSDVRIGDHNTFDRNSTTVKNINEHSARLGEADTLPSTNPLRSQDPGTYSKDIFTDGEGSKSPNGSHKSSSNSLPRNISNGQPSRSRPGSRNIFDTIDPTTEEGFDALELSPTASPTNGYVETGRSAERDSTADQPKPASRRQGLNPKEDITKRPTPQPRPRLSAPRVADAEQSEIVNDRSPSPSPRPTSPTSPDGPRPFRKGKGPDGSDQAALLANIIRKTPRPVSHVEPDNEEGTTYW